MSGFKYYEQGRGAKKIMTVQIEYDNDVSLKRAISYVTNSALPFGEIRVRRHDCNIMVHKRFAIDFAEPNIEEINGVKCLVYRSQLHTINVKTK
jgi:hypothetical protein